MAVSPLKTWVSGEVLTASDLNAEFSRIYTAGIGLVSPLTSNFDLDGNTLILDADGDSSLKVSTNNRYDLTLAGAIVWQVDGTVASVVNGLVLTGSAAGSGVSLGARGSDTNIQVTLAGKGTGAVLLGQSTSTDVRLVADQPIADSSGNEYLKFSKTASAVNEFTIINAATGVRPTLRASGESNIGFTLSDSNGNEVIIGASTASAVNEVTATNAATGNPPTISASGGDTNVGLVLAGKGIAGIGMTGAPISAPTGRLTLSTGVPVMTSTVSGATTIYYTPYAGAAVPIYDGTRFILYPFSELSQATTDSTKSPAAVANNSVYDLFVWNDSGTLRCTRGPAWSSDTARAAGGALTLQNGIYLNTSAITNGPAASRGTWVGTVRSNGSSQIDFIFGALAAGGTAAFFGVWNAYNRVNVATMVQDSTDSWTLASSSIRSANGSTTMRVTMVRGANEDAILATYAGLASPSASGSAQLGVGIDSTSAFSGWPTYCQTGTLLAAAGGYMGLPGLGVHFVQALESSQNAGTQTFYGDNAAPTYTQNGLSVLLRA